MRVMTVFGTRPEIIRLSRIIRQLDRFCDHVLVNTGQNYDPNLNDIFLEQLKIREPDHHLGIQAEGFASQASQIIERCGRLFEQSRPQRLVVLGDTNSGLSAIVAARMGIPVFHLEAGNRCYDDRVPEEFNRRLIDHSSTILMPYTYRSLENLLREGFERDRIYVIGNPIFEVLRVYEKEIDASDIHRRLELQQQGYILATLHRAENVDLSGRLGTLLEGLSVLTQEHGIPCVVSLHPRTADKISRFGHGRASKRLRLLKPLNFFDFVRLEKSARAVISDSGTVQEECAIFGVPNVTIRDVTERAETIEAGTNILAGADKRALQRAVAIALGTGKNWQPPREYLWDDVSRTVAKIVLGHLGPVGRVRLDPSNCPEADGSEREPPLAQ